jgi:hypothetical protein
MMTRAIQGVFLLALACATGCVGLDFSRDTVASHPARWEYLTIHPEQAPVTLASTSGTQTDPELTRLGAEGWELVAVNNGAYILKRPKKN